jgi:hypothetical protein
MRFAMVRGFVKTVKNDIPVRFAPVLGSKPTPKTQALSGTGSAKTSGQNRDVAGKTENTLRIANSAPGKMRTEIEQVATAPCRPGFPVGQKRDRTRPKKL